MKTKIYAILTIITSLCIVSLSIYKLITHINIPALSSLLSALMVLFLGLMTYQSYKKNDNKKRNIALILFLIAFILHIITGIIELIYYFSN